MMHGESSTRAEIIVVGGGVIGLALAYELLRRGRRVTVLDRARPGRGATQAAGGMLAPVSEAGTEPDALVCLGSDSLRRYPAFVAGLEDAAGSSCGYRTIGSLWAGVDRDDLSEIDHLETTLKGKGLEVERLDVAALRVLEPHLSHRAAGGLLVPGDHDIDPRRLTRALVAAIARLGGVVVPDRIVDEVEVRAGHVAGVRGTARDGRAFLLEAERVVLAAGAWSTRGIRSPLGRFGLRPVKGQLVRLTGEKLLRRVVRTPRVYLIPRDDGELLVGATMEETGFETSATAGAVLDLLRYGWEMLPGVYDLAFTEVAVGLRSVTDDQIPVLGESEVPGLFVAFGHFRNGVLLAPATAELLADWIDSGVAPGELEPFGPQRITVQNAPGVS